MEHYVVVVLGDIGRSPRMQNHCVCLKNLPDSSVHIIGYTDSPLFKELVESDNVIVHRIRPFISLPRWLFPVYAVFKILWLLLQLLIIAIRLPKFEVVLAQNPPSMPTVPFCWFLKLIKGKKFVIDWHNLGYSILKVNKTHNFIVNIAEKLEFFFGIRANGHITVTEALKQLLEQKGIKSSVVYDRPSNIFQPNRDHRGRFAEQLKIDDDDIWIMTATSWTPDEKVAQLIDTAEVLENMLKDDDKGVSFIITGKGPDRRAFEAEVNSRNFTHVSFKCLYLDSYEDYAKLLASCDAGVSLHISSSGVDLPMKGLDMVGAGLPLLSVNYQCISELVDDHVNGLLFDDPRELAQIINKLFFTKEIDVEELRHGSIKSGERKWDQEWEENAKPVLTIQK